MEETEQFNINGEDCLLKMCTNDGVGISYEIVVDGKEVAPQTSWPLRGTMLATKDELIFEKLGWLVKRAMTNEENRLRRTFNRDEVKVVIK